MRGISKEYARQLEQQARDMGGVVSPTAAIPGNAAPETDAEQRLSEKGFQAAVIKYAREQGWTCYHVYDSRKSMAGFPDLVMWRYRQLAPGRVVFAELKTDTGKTTPEQDEVHSGLKAAGAEMYLWRPSDWETIRRVLA